MVQLSDVIRFLRINSLQVSMNFLNSGTLIMVRHKTVLNIDFKFVRVAPFVRGKSFLYRVEDPKVIQ